MAVPERCPIDRSRGAARKRRLKRGVARFVQATRLDHYRVRSVAELTLTFERPEHEAAEGEIVRFWHEVRRLFPGTRYFCWLELHESGRLHYHALWLNPPPRSQFDLHQDVHRIWRNGRTRGRRKWPKNWGEDSLKYVLAYAKKMGKKAYQQDYDQLPSTLRTFMNQRLGYDLSALDHVRDRPIVVYVGEVATKSWLRREFLELRGVITHAPTSWCQVSRQTRRGRPPPLLRSPHTGLPGPEWRRQSAIVVQRWLPT